MNNRLRYASLLIILLMLSIFILYDFLLRNGTNTHEYESGLKGEWVGEFVIHGKPYELSIDFTRTAGGWTGTEDLSSIFERQLLTSVEIRENKIKFSSSTSEFRGQFKDDIIIGDYQIDYHKNKVHFYKKGSERAQSLQKRLKRSIKKYEPKELKLVDREIISEDLNEENLKSLIKKADSANSASIALLHKGELIGEWYSGGKRSQTRIGSITKVFTGLAVGHFMHSNNLSMNWLDTPAHKFLPEWSKSEHKYITIRHY